MSTQMIADMVMAVSFGMTTTPYYYFLRASTTMQQILKISSPAVNDTTATR